MFELGSLVQSRGVVGGRTGRLGIVVGLLGDGEILRICWHKSDKLTHVLSKDMTKAVI